MDLQQEGTSNNEQEVTFKEPHGISAGFKNNGEVNSNHRVSFGKTLSTLGSIVIPPGSSSIATSSMISMQTNKESKGKEQRTIRPNSPTTAKENRGRRLGSGI